MSKYVILVPARSGSQRIINKNIRQFSGSSLLEIKLKQAKRVFKDIDLILNTDSKKYLELYDGLYDIGVLRPKEYATSDIPMNDVYEYFANSLNQYQTVIYLNPTSPLIKDMSLIKILEMYENLREEAITTVTKHYEYLWINNKPINYDPSHHPKSQNLPPFYTLNFAASILKINEMKIIRNIVTKTPHMYTLDNIESFDIDDEWQFNIAENLFNRINTKNMIEK
tara:strand:+ start:4064 stop:4738 length:675 start_codon:yes stop_codon:yes gene_type:complete